MSASAKWWSGSRYKNCHTAQSWYEAGYVNVRRRYARAALSLVANYTYAKNLIDAPDFRSPAVYDVPQIHGKSWVRALSRNLPRPRHLHSATRAGIPCMVRVCTLDLAVVRSFVLTESLKLEMLAEGFNALNHSNLGTPNRFVNTPQFGTITEASTPGRQIQLSARISF